MNGTATFTNRHGERFSISSNGVFVTFKGDETKWEMVRLFNPEFDIWSARELVLLGKALIKIGEDA